MNRRLPAVTVAVVVSVLLTPLAQVIGAQVAGADTYAFTTGTPSLDTITNGTSAAPWNESQGDPASPAYTSQSPGTLLPTYTPGGAATGSGATAEPNLAVYPGRQQRHRRDQPVPERDRRARPGPSTATAGPAARPPSRRVRRCASRPGPPCRWLPPTSPTWCATPTARLTGYFDYRPKDADEAIVAASSTDNGTELDLRGRGPRAEPRLLPSADINDDGEGHPNVITVGGTTRLYTLQRPAGDNPGVGMLVHTLHPDCANPLAGAPGHRAGRHRPRRLRHRGRRRCRSPGAPASPSRSPRPARPARPSSWWPAASST